MTVPFMYSFRSTSNQIPYDFLKFNFSHFSPQVRLFFLEKGNLKFSDSKMRWKEESEKFSLSSNLKLHLTSEALVIRKDSSSPRMTKQIQIFIAPLRIHFERSKNTLDSLKSVFNAFRRKPSLGAPVSSSRRLTCYIFCHITSASLGAVNVSFR